MFWSAYTTVAWIVLTCFVGIGAQRRGRSAVGWFIFALFLSPLVATLSLFLLGEIPNSRNRASTP